MIMRRPAGACLFSSLFDDDDDDDDAVAGACGEENGYCLLNQVE